MITFNDFIAWEATTHDTIDFKTVYVDMTGDLIAGLMLSQIVYWHLPSKHNGKSKLRIVRDGKMWLAKRREDWWDEIRISPAQADRALKILEECGLVETALFRFGGSPTKHIHLNTETFLSVFQETANSNLNNPEFSESANSNSATADMKVAETRKTCTETTPETTAENKESTSGASAPEGIPSPEICTKCHKPKSTTGHNRLKDCCTCDGKATLEAVFGEKQERESDPSPAEIIVNGICQYNGLSRGIDALAKKTRLSWIEKVRTICDLYETTPRHARLAWKAYILRFGFKEQVSPFYASFDSEISPLLAAARDGDITAESLQTEERGGNGKKPATQTGGGYNAPSPEQIERDRELLRQRRQARLAPA